MKKYDYYKAVKKDIKKNLAKIFNNQVTESFDLYDEVTGDKSGAYTCDKKAKSYVRQNMDLLKKACSEFGIDLSEYIAYPFRCDTIIRSYVFKETFEKIIQESVWEHFPDEVVD